MTTTTKTTTLLRVLALCFFAALILMGQRPQAVQADPEVLTRIYLPLVFAAGELPPPANTSVLYVRPGATGNCQSGTSPCADIKQALALAKVAPHPNVLIRMAQGTYTGWGAAVAELSFGWNEAPRNITIEGGYGSGWSSISTDPALSRIDGQNARRGVLLGGITNYSFTLKNMTIQNGLVNQPFADGSYMGGGLFCHNSGSAGNFIALTFTNVVFANNRAQGVGSNAVGGGGAALYNRCNATLTNVSFNDNVIQAGDATDGTRGGTALGGGLFQTSGYTEYVTLQAANISFNRNQALAGNGGTGQSPNGWRPDALGGGLALQFTNGSIAGLTARSNTAKAGNGSDTGGYGAGGGVFAEYYNLQVTDASIIGNVATGGNGYTASVGAGGGFMLTDGNFTLERAKVANNSSYGGSGTMAGTAGGGGLYLTTARTDLPVSTNTLVNVMVTDNRSEAGQGQDRYGGGGGIFLQNSNLTMTHGTFARNSVLSTMMAPAMIILGERQTQATLWHTIVAEHPRASSPDALIAQQASNSLIMNRTLFYGNVGNYGVMFPGAVIQNNNPVPSGNPAFLSPGAPNYDYSIGANSAARNQATGSTQTLDVNREPRYLPDVGADEYN